MTTESLFTAIASASGLVFVVGIMLATGLSLTTGQILQPLRNARLVVLALLANFVLVPLAALGIMWLVPLDESLKIGLVVLATVAGAPFLVKEIQIARGDLGTAVGLMFLLMMVTIVYVPLVLPLMLPGVEVNPWDIATSLMVTMLVPLVVGLVVNSSAPEDAQRWAPVMNRMSGLSLVVALVVGVGLNASTIVDLVGSLGFLALFLLIGASLLVGFVLGGRDAVTRTAMTLGTGQRNLAAAILVTTLNFSDTMALPFVLVASIVMPVILIVVALLIGRRAGAEEAVPAAAVNVP
jgi:predicted Na+-dependent transporter